MAGFVSDLASSTATSEDALRVLLSLLAGEYCQLIQPDRHAS